MAVLQELLHKDPDLTIRNAQGKTAIDVAGDKRVLGVFCEYLGEEAKTSARAATPRAEPELLKISNKSIKVFTRRKQIVTNTEDLSSVKILMSV